MSRLNSLDVTEFQKH